MDNPDSKLKKKTVGSVLLAAVCILGAVYVFSGFHYGNTFYPQTEVNGIAVSGRTVDGANELLVKEVPAGDYTLEIVDRNGEKEYVRGTDIGFRRDFSPSLQSLKKQGFRYGWPFEAMGEHSYRAEPTNLYNAKKAEEVLNSLNCVSEAARATRNANRAGYEPMVKIVLGKEGYELRNEAEEIPDVDQLKDLILTAVTEGKERLELDRESYFIDFGMEEEIAEKEAEFETVQAMQEKKVIYEKDGETMELTPRQISLFLARNLDGTFKKDPEGNFVLNDAKVGSFVDDVAERFNTVGKPVTWKKIRGGTVEIEKSTFGFLVDKQAEMEELKKDLNGEEEIHRAPLGTGPNGIGNGEIGDTYVEVDISAQKLYYVSENRVRYSSDVVTGDMSRKGRSTPEVVCYVYYKQLHRTLIGPDYQTPVNYWMAVYNNVGLHDATWRGRFGGNIYKTGGSHGCVNLPLKSARELYGLLEVGTPVILYY